MPYLGTDADHEMKHPFSWCSCKIVTLCSDVLLLEGQGIQSWLRTAGGIGWVVAGPRDTARIFATF